jgi:hypothetical protein
MVVVVLEQILCDAGDAVTVGIGLTVTVAVTGMPGQVPAVGVMVYTAVPALVPVAVNVCAIEVPELLEAPLTLVCVTLQANVLPVTLLVSATEVAPPEQMLCAFGVAVALGIGFTVIGTVIGVPLQPPADGVIE